MRIPGKIDAHFLCHGKNLLLSKPAVANPRHPTDQRANQTRPRGPSPPSERLNRRCTLKRRSAAPPERRSALSGGYAPRLGGFGPLRSLSLALRHNPSVVRTGTQHHNNTPCRRVSRGARALPLVRSFSIPIPPSLTSLLLPMMRHPAASASSRLVIPSRDPASSSRLVIPPRHASRHPVSSPCLVPKPSPPTPPQTKTPPQKKTKT